MGDDFCHDDIHIVHDAEEDDEDALEDEKEFSASSDEGSPCEFETAVAANETSAVAAVDSAEGSSRSEQNAVLSASQADALHQVRTTIAALESTLDTLRMTGVVRGVQFIEADLHKERRRERDLVRESPAVAETFLRLRRAEVEEFQGKKLLVAQMNQRKQDAAAAIAARNAAVAELDRTKRKLQELESTRACKHAIKTFTLEALGAGSANAGGAKANKTPFRGLGQAFAP